MIMHKQVYGRAQIYRKRPAHPISALKFPTSEFMNFLNFLYVGGKVLTVLLLFKSSKRMVSRKFETLPRTVSSKLFADVEHFKVCFFLK